MRQRPSCAAAGQPAARLVDCVCHLRCLPAGWARWWLACRVLLKIVYLLTCRVLSLAVLVFRSDRAKDAELLVLRHENAVLRRHVGRVRYEPCNVVLLGGTRSRSPARKDLSPGSGTLRRAVRPARPRMQCQIRAHVPPVHAGPGLDRPEDPRPPRPRTGDLRRPWERPALPGRLTPARVRREFKNIRAKVRCPAGAPKPGKPGPGRPSGSKNRHPVPRHDVGKRRRGNSRSRHDENAQVKRQANACLETQ
jgi:hypothetical protein